jgi:hypothetical protein
MGSCADRCESNEGLFTWHIAALFGIVVVAIVVWKQISQNRSDRDELGYEKTLA